MSPLKPPHGNLTAQEAAHLGVKLRESCDSCLAAKVKCEKGRPFCQRCLTNGNDCRYSPSARAGRKQRNSSNGGISKPPPRKRPASIEIPSNFPMPSGPVSSPWTPQFLPQPHDHSAIQFSNNVPIDQHNTQAFISNTPPLTNDDQKTDVLRGESKEAITQINGSNESGHQYPSPPFNDPLADIPPHCTEPHSASSAASFPDLVSTMPSPATGIHNMLDSDAWMMDDPSYGTHLDLFPGPLDIISHDAMLSMQSPLEFNPYEKSSLDDTLLQWRGNGMSGDTSQRIQDGTEGRQECGDCFAACLTALHSLHAHSWNTTAAERGFIPFDVILTINREAIRGCHAMMNCVNCSTKNGLPVSTMLLGTVFGKVMSLYRAAVNNRQKPTHETPLAFGAYTALAEDRYHLETEILLFELNKVQRIMGQFQKKCRDSNVDQDSNGVYEPQASYLASQLNVIVDFLQTQKEQSAGGI